MVNIERARKTRAHALAKSTVEQDKIGKRRQDSDINLRRPSARRATVFDQKKTDPSADDPNVGGVLVDDTGVAVQVHRAAVEFNAIAIENPDEPEQPSYDCGSCAL